ncbi:C45 family autoproteolytic acyltransferase/hydolase [Actinomadura spongiicola]|uniref:C45 family autoproteolytic acyltransferase/hydolase n=1 Tax=Actinomadura spongiicola TaxID=2303421 RepID=UPI0018F1E891|nr:C45 family peptidase [Actinomadura spongiicola]
MTDVPFVRAAGDAATLGRLHGAARAEALRAFLDDSLCRLNRLLDLPQSMDGLRPVLDAYRAEIEAQTPDLAAEIRGLAEGAGLTPEEATLLQVRREVLGYRKVPVRGDCTTYARAGAGTPVLAQTVDLNGDLEDQIAVLEVAPEGSGRRSLLLSFAGLLGYLGVNSDGLAVGLNLLLGGDWRPGLPPYLAIRHLLDTTADVDEATRALAGLRVASSRSLTLCDRSGKAAYVEILGDDLRIVEAPQIVHTNHYLHPEFAPHDELNVFARNSSLRRLEACTARLAALPASAGAEEHFGVLSAPPIRVPDEGDIRLDKTVAAVVMRPDQGRLYVRPGDPSRSRTHVFTLS